MSRDSTWIDWYYSKLGLPLPATAALSGLALFAAGLAFAIASNFHRVYLSTLFVYMGCFGVGWVTACIRWGMTRLPVHLEGIRSCFLVDEDQYKFLIDTSLRRMCNKKAALIFSLVIATVAWIVSYRGIIGFGTPIDLQKQHLFPAAWYEGDRLMNLFIIDLYGLICALPLGTGLWLLLQNAILLWKINRLPVVPIPGLLIARFRGITGFYLQVSTTWFVGVALFGVLFFKHLDLIAALVLVVTGGFGALTFFLPQLVFHSFLIRAAARIAEHVNALFREEADSILVGSALSVSSFEANPAALTKLANMVQVTQPTPMWVYDYKDILILLFGQLLALVPLALKPLVENLLENLK